MKATSTVATLGTILAAAMLQGCTQQARQEYSAAGTTAATAAKETGKAIKTDAATTGKEVATSAITAEKDVQAQSARAEAMASNDETSARIKAALVAAQNLHTGDLRVDTDGKKVTLKGTIPTQSEKERASQIAQEQLGPWFTVKNQLVVSPK